MTTENTGTQSVETGTVAENTAASASVASESASATTASTTGQAGTQTGEAAAAAPTGTGTAAQVESFFDPKSIEGKPELQAAYRQMQKAYTQKTQRIAEERRKIEAYDQFTANPESVAQYLAQMGYQIARPGQQAAPAADRAGARESGDFQPQTWEEVRDWILENAESRFRQQIEPVMNNIRETTAKNVEQQLNGIDPNWRLYEDDMKDTLRQHPTLVKDVAKLYRMSVPEDVLHSRAVQEALQKHTARQASASVHGSGTTARTAPAPRKVNSFSDAVEVAREALRQQR